MTRKRTAQILEGLLQAIDRMGGFTGSGKSRNLFLTDVVDMKTGKITKGQDVLLNWLMKELRSDTP